MRNALFAGPFLMAFILALPAPPGLGYEAWLAAGLALWMAIWWLREAVPLAATALLPLALAPLLGLAPLEEVTRAYSHPLILLFLGGFLLARAIERWELHARIAHGLLGLAGDRPARILGAVMAATAFLSLWISNTASAMVMAPIAAALAGGAHAGGRFATALMLGVAFAATIGGMGSLIGTPPNAIFAALMAQTYGVEIGFARWAMLGLPVALLLLALAWAMLARWSPGLGPVHAVVARAESTGPMTRGERKVAWIAGLTALAWIARPFVQSVFPDLALSDAGIAMLAALALFSLSSGEAGGGRLLDWETAVGLRWDVLILFGGGLALAGLIEESGLAPWIGGQVARLEGLPMAALVLIMAALIVYIGELASNTAMAAIFLPIAGASASSLGVDPVLFMVPVALAASVGFMLPVATPPNAIVFSHAAVSRADMLKAGAPLDLIGIAVAVGLSLVLGPLVF